MMLNSAEIVWSGMVSSPAALFILQRLFSCKNRYSASY